MLTKHKYLFWIGLLSFLMVSPIASATPAEDFASAEKSFNEEDIKEATRLLRAAADQNYLPAQVRMGQFMYGSTDYEEAFGWFLTAAFQGDAAGQYELGQMYGLGYGTDKNPDKAFFWTKKSAEQNYLPAVQLLADLYKPEAERKILINFLGISPNAEQAAFWGAKLPELEDAAAKRSKRIQALQKKKDIEAAEKAKKEQSKLLCGLKC
ncbi:MAG: sel1 repeat family protein [Gallionella sp.]|nr:sel1 repeat family protein [Gallionella sp.]